MKGFVQVTVSHSTILSILLYILTSLTVKAQPEIHVKISEI